MRLVLGFGLPALVLRLQVLTYGAAQQKTAHTIGMQPKVSRPNMQQHSAVRTQCTSAARAAW